MRAELAKLPIREVYRLLAGCIAPRPIAWVSTISPNGHANLAPFSFFNGVGANPPAVSFSPVNNRDGSKKDTLRNIEANGEFVVNVVPFSLAQAMNHTAAEYPYETSEFMPAGVTMLPSAKIKPPRVQESPVHFECVTEKILYLGQGALGANLVIGRIVLLEIADSVLASDGSVDPAKLDLIGRLGGDQYVRTREVFEMGRPPRPA